MGWIFTLIFIFFMAIFPINNAVAETKNINNIFFTDKEFNNIPYNLKGLWICLGHSENNGLNYKKEDAHNLCVAGDEVIRIFGEDKGLSVEKIIKTKNDNNKDIYLIFFNETNDISWTVTDNGPDQFNQNSDGKTLWLLQIFENIDGELVEHTRFFIKIFNVGK